jgi:hypothetical protein
LADYQLFVGIRQHTRAVRLACGDAQQCNLLLLHCDESTPYFRLADVTACVRPRPYRHFDKTLRQVRLKHKDSHVPFVVGHNCCTIVVLVASFIEPSV